MRHAWVSRVGLIYALGTVVMGAALILVGFGTSLVHAEPMYTFTDLGTLEGGPHSGAFGINNAGQVVGYSHTDSGESYATKWIDGTVTILGTLGGNSLAYGINNAGQVVGFSTMVSSNRAFLWTNGTMENLGSLGGTFATEAFSINASAQVVGYSHTPNNSRHAYLWSSGTMQDLGTLGGSSSEARGINDLEQVVGYSYPTGNAAVQPTLWSGNTITDLGTFGGNFGEALGINNAGQVVGFSRTASGEERPFLWSNGNMQSLGTLGGRHSYGYGINTAGQVVGTSNLISNDEPYHATLWNGSVLIDLNNVVGSGSAGWTLVSAQAINDVGQIVGFAVNSLRYEHAYLLTPVPPNDSPICNAAQAFPTVLWSPNHQFVPIVVMGVTDPDGDAVTITVTGVTQDEPVNAKGDGNTSPDAVIEAGAASVRAERSGKGNGRVYEVSFKADDGTGGSCTGKVTVGVPHSLGKGLTAIDDGQLYDSTVP